MNERAESAIKYAKLGFKIVMLHGINKEGNCTCSKGASCKNSGKHPIYSGWEEKATSSEKQLVLEFEDHPYANIGFATGYNFLVLDIDKKHGGYESIKEYGKLTKTVSVKTGGGGSHHYYKIPKGINISNKVGLIPGVDIRSKGGFVVAPTSIHKSGTSYQWIKEYSIADIEMVEPDSWLIALITNKKKSFVEVPEIIEEGSRNAVMASIAGSLRRKGLSHQAILAALLAENENRCNPPLDDSEVENIARSISRYTPEDPVTGEEWSQHKKDELITIISELDDFTQIFEPKLLNLISQAKENDPATYAVIKARLKGKVNLRDLEKAIKYMNISSNEEKYTKQPLRLKGLEAKNFVVPYDWKVDLQSGITRFIHNGDGSGKQVTVSFAPVVISRRFNNLDTQQEKVEISFYRDGHWKKILAPRSVIFNRNSILKLADNSFPVSSNNAGDLISYLSDFEQENDKAIPVVRSVSRLGWLKDGGFFPYSRNETLEFETDSKEATKVMEGIELKGEESKWLSIATKARENLAARFIISASFASVLLEPLHKRVFFIHLWHNSRSGKTATLKLAISAFGNPHKLIGSFNSTIVGLEKLAAGLRNLPFAIDELQVLNTKRMSVDSIIYMLSQGQGRTRGSKGGGLQETSTWRNIILTTGEEAMLGTNAQDGANTRTFELYTKPVEDTNLATIMHEISESNYGHAGEKFVNKLLKEEKHFIQEQYDKIKDKLKAKYPDNIHLDEVAVVCLGDYLSSIYVFEEDEKIALEGALETTIAMIENNRQLTQTDNIERAWEMFTGWIIANSERFSFDPISPRYGRMDGEDKYFVIPSFAHKALEEVGFSPRKAFRGFGERGYIENQIDSEGIRRFQIAKSILGKTCRVYVVNLPIETDREEEFEFLS